MIYLNDNEFIEITSFLKRNYGINLEFKRQLIEARLCNIITEKGFCSFRDYFDFVYSNESNDEIAILINKVTTHHTFFMREFEHFKFFQNTVMPQLHKNIKNRDLRIWSAGCSSGEEAYTLSMIIQDFLAEEKSLWDKKILATDISPNVIDIAQKGIYSSDSLENVPEIWKLTYFDKIDSELFKASTRLKNEVIFRVFNLMDEFPFKKKFHVIFCRNVMIYFDNATKLKLIKKFYDMTEKGGYLFIGLSESLNKEEIPYKYIMPSVYMKG